jgi:hypothetical protein
MASLACTIVSQKSRANSYSSTGTDYCGVITNSGSSTKYYNFCLKFTTPSFSGKSKNLSVTMNAMDNSPENSTIPLRWALCTSDANFSKYQTSYTVTDSY